MTKHVSSKLAAALGAAVRVTNLHKSFGPTTVLRGITLEVPAGQTVVVLGRSGSGKSTLLRCINQLEEVTSGEVYVDGERLGETSGLSRYVSSSKLARQRRTIGMIFQQFNLFPHLTVLENIAVSPIKVKGLPRAEAEANAHSLLRRVGLDEKATAYPGQLSGGQKQRVAIARALAMKPKLLLCDEPTSALDPEMTREVLGILSSLAGEGMTMLIVTHEMGFAQHVADRIILMHEGRVAEDTAPSEFFGPHQSDTSRAFLSAERSL